jgi:hypothetical protein
MSPNSFAKYISSQLDNVHENIVRNVLMGSATQACTTAWSRASLPSPFGSRTRALNSSALGDAIPEDLLVGDSIDMYCV